jgi:heptosyltransferase-2
LLEGFPPESKIVLLGSPHDRPVAQEFLRVCRGPVLDWVGKTSLKELIFLISRCSLFLTNDSGPLHLASALGVPTVALFGPTVKAFGFFPETDKTTILERLDLACRPCSVHGGKICPQKHFRCMLDISVERMVQAGRAHCADGASPAQICVK